MVYFLGNLTALEDGGVGGREDAADLEGVTDIPGVALLETIGREGVADLEGVLDDLVGVAALKIIGGGFIGVMIVLFGDIDFAGGIILLGVPMRSPKPGEFGRIFVFAGVMEVWGIKVFAR